MRNKNKHITLSAFFIALGILIPMLFHFIGLGPVFLPMFWPVAVSAFFLPIFYTVTVGILTPFISILLTGMPPIPILYQIIFEFIFLTSIINLLYKKTFLGVFWIMSSSLICALAAGLIGALAVAPIFGFPPEFYAAVILVRNLPGIITMIVVIPVFIKKITNEPLFKRRRQHV